MNFALFSFKIWRESKRIVRQILYFPPTAIEFFFATPWYDHVVSKSKIVTRNGQRNSDKVAIFLIFPDTGLLASHLLSLNYLVESNFDVVVVSNGALSDLDRGALLKICWILIERPNYGYDFGGYRDAILTLADDLCDIKRLVLLNDSTWFPLPNSSNWLGDVEALDVDFCGAGTAYGIDRRHAKEFEKITWNYSTKRSHFHYCSFALAFSNSLITHPDFLPFWRNLRLTSNKLRVVRRGEIGLSQWARNRDFSHASTFDVAQLAVLLHALPVERIAVIVKRIIFPPDKRTEKAHQLVLSRLEMTEEWRHYAVQYILSCVILFGVSYSTAEFNLKELRFAFLKKAPLSAGVVPSNASLEIIKELPEPARQVILNEALALRARLDKRTQTKTRPS